MKVYLREHRVAAGLDQKDLVEISGVNKDTVSRIDRTGSGRKSTVEKLATAMGKTLDDLRRLPFPNEYVPSAELLSRESITLQPEEGIKPLEPQSMTFEEYKASVRAVMFRNKPNMTEEQFKDFIDEILRELYNDKYGKGDRSKS